MSYENEREDKAHEFGNNGAAFFNSSKYRDTPGGMAACFAVGADWANNRAQSELTALEKFAEAAKVQFDVFTNYTGEVGERATAFVNSAEWKAVEK